METYDKGDEEPPLSPPVPWAILILNFFATLALAFPFYTSYVALPQMMVSMSANLEEIQWVLTAYAMAQTVMMPTVGWLGSRLGSRRLFALCLLLTTAGSTFSGLAWSTESLVFFRMLQGAGAGPLSPLSMAIMFDAFPPDKRGLALGFNTAYWAVGALIALPLGGYLIETVSWRTIFLVGLPLGVISLVMAWVALPCRASATAGGLDYWGFTTMGLLLVPLLFGLSQGRYYGWDDPVIRLSFAVAAVSGVAFVLVEMRRAVPLVNLRLLTIFPFAMACTVRFLNHIGFNAHSLLVALFLQHTLDYTPLQAGLAVLPAALAVGPAGLTMGRLSDRIDPRIIFLLGLLMMTVGVYLFSSVNSWTPVVWVMTLVVLLRVGAEGVFSPLNNASLRLLPAEWVRMGSGLLGLMWGVGGSVGNALTVALLDYRQAVHAIEAGQDTYRHPIEQLYALNEVQNILQRAGGMSESLVVQAQEVLSQHLAREASVAAFQDCFLLTAIVFLLAMVPALCIRPRRRQVWRKPG
ncbi:MAG TPA: DHA2 family efflux MFS transporter permease subunit [Alphaproteobacteria bacterium]|nr:DHA2 family efflux MFS transporter permease subunit [Alphaproteobacteria bacterium]